MQHVFLFAFLKTIKCIYFNLALNRISTCAEVETTLVVSFTSARVHAVLDARSRDAHHCHNLCEGFQEQWLLQYRPKHGYIVLTAER